MNATNCTTNAAASPRYSSAPANQVPIGTGVHYALSRNAAEHSAQFLNRGGSTLLVPEFVPHSSGAAAVPDAWCVVDTETLPAPLSPAVRELLTLLVEECAEASQRATKILRFGARRNPCTGERNVEGLERELGDVLAVMELLTRYGVIDRERTARAQFAKLNALADNDGRLLYAVTTPDLEPEIERGEEARP